MLLHSVSDAIECLYICHCAALKAAARIEESDESGGSFMATLDFEMFVIPRLPEGTIIPAPPSKKKDNVLFRQLRTRWLRGYSTWQRTYLQWYPRASLNRNFDAFAVDHTTQAFRPLSCFLTPLSVPTMIGTPGPLLHWIGCVGYLTPSKDSG